MRICKENGRTGTFSDNRHLLSPIAKQRIGCLPKVEGQPTSIVDRISVIDSPYSAFFETNFRYCRKDQNPSIGSYSETRG
jgi:hypothetical protein